MVMEPMGAGWPRARGITPFEPSHLRKLSKNINSPIIHRHATMSGRLPRTLESKIDAKDIEEARDDRNTPFRVGPGAAPASTAAETGGASISAVEKQIVVAFVRKTTPRVRRTEVREFDAEDIEDDW